MRPRLGRREIVTVKGAVRCFGEKRGIEVRHGETLASKRHQAMLLEAVSRITVSPYHR